MIAGVRRRLDDPLVVNAVLLMATTGLMAAAGAIFWVVAARLVSPAQVGLAGSLVSGTVTLAYLGQLGLNITLVRTLQRSDRPADDVKAASVLVAGAALVLGAGYALLLPVFSPRLAAVVDHPLLIVAFVLLVAGTAVNQLTDSVFLGVRRVATNLWINGGLMSVLKVGLPVVLAGAGAFGLYAATGLASTVAAACGLALVLRRLPRTRGWRPSGELIDARRFAGAGYVTTVMDLLPLLVLPVVVLNAAGAQASGVYFVSYQVTTFVNSMVFAIGSSMYAEGEASSVADLPRVVRKAGLVIAGAVGAVVILLLLVAPLLLHVFGPTYADAGTGTMRVMALGALGVAGYYWSAIRLRLSRNVRAMLAVPVCTAVVTIAGALVVAHRGPEWVAGAWGVGQAFGALLGYVVSRTVAPPGQGRGADELTAAGAAAAEART